MIQMKIINLFYINISHNVAVYDDKGVMVPKVGNIFYGSGCSQNDRLMPSDDRDGIFLSGQKGFYPIIQMVRVDNNLFATCTLKLPNCVQAVCYGQN